MDPNSTSTVLAYKRLGGVPLWILIGIVVIAFVVFAVRNRGGR
ncbi:hypothetical protein ABZ829_32355 [Streptomyces xanthochromogenes]